ncbi:hypothetical protein ANCDUO_12828 [Ancylostoma duodenale]|uniref:CUB domain-containing protein n=1 Tax=Ancylostoma duodenale TaxID=51022 RepID=A0A0C2GDP1_9BILA|nr:hypothetical protein ANCDUO_12828 [Ancylostoma duodenale]
MDRCVRKAAPIRLGGRACVFALAQGGVSSAHEDNAHRAYSPGQKIRFQLTYVYFKCAPTCEEFVEIKYDESLDRTGFRQCCRAEYDELVSHGNTILILTHATENSQFVLRYRMGSIATNYDAGHTRYNNFEHGRNGPSGVPALRNVAVAVSESVQEPVLAHRAMVRQCKHKYVTYKDAPQGVYNPSNAAKTISYQIEIRVRVLKDKVISAVLLQEKIFVAKIVSYENQLINLWVCIAIAS